MGGTLAEVDETGAFVAVGLERAEAVRSALSVAGIAFQEGDPDDCGCGGPSVALFRLHRVTDVPALERRLAAALAAALDGEETK